MSILMRGVLAALVLIAPTATQAEIPIDVRGSDASEVHEQADGSVLHRASGIRFPKFAGSMEIGKLVVYRAGDASAVYYASGAPGDTLLSFYIYPADRALDAEEKLVAQSIEQAWTAKRITAPVDLSLPPDVRSGWYEVQREAVTGSSVYAVARRGDWFLKARVTTPHSAGRAGLDLVQAGVSALPWQAFSPAPADVTAPNATNSIGN